VRFGWLLVLCGCGRIGFDSSGTSTGDGGGSGVADAGPSLCAGTQVLVCDGFEGVLDAQWSIDAFGGGVMTDSTHAYRGAKSIHVHTDAIVTPTPDPRATLMTSQGLPVTGTIYARVWAYFASPNPTVFFDQLVNFANIAGTGISLGAQDGFMVNNDYTAPVYSQSATVHLPLDRWTCLQLAIPSGTSGTSRAYVDGAEVVDIAITKAPVQPRSDHVYLGLEWVGNIASQPAVDAWIDEVIIDNAPTTCAE
jgi:hypothetical protein